jgi:hypothetical protein
MFECRYDRRQIASPVIVKMFAAVLRAVNNALVAGLKNG